MNRRAWLAALLGASLISAGGIYHIKSQEGIRYAAYPDPGTRGAPWTICYGHTYLVTPTTIATQAECDKWLGEDLAIAEDYVRRYVKVPVSQGEYDAYTSFVFNAGPVNFKNSTMLRVLNAGDHRSACVQFYRWIYADRRVLNGLVKRRNEEAKMCLMSLGKEIIYDPARD